jgi:hypothetical protein
MATIFEADGGGVEAGSDGCVVGVAEGRGAGTGMITGSGVGWAELSDREILDCWALAEVAIPIGTTRLSDSVSVAADTKIFINFVDGRAHSRR